MRRSNGPPCYRLAKTPESCDSLARDVQGGQHEKSGESPAGLPTAAGGEDKQEGLSPDPLKWKATAPNRPFSEAWQSG